MEFGESGSVIQKSSTSTEELSGPINEHAFTEGPRSLTGLFRWTTIGLTLYMVVNLLLLLAVLFLIWLYLPSTIVPFDMAALESIDLAIGGLGIAEVSLFLFCAIIVARCTYRAMKNLYTIGSKHPEMSPGWAVGWYFVPIASLFKPAEGMSQIVHGTRHAVGNLSSSGSGIPLWWSCWILTNISQSVSDQIVRISGASIDAQTQIIALVFSAASAVFGILSAWALMRLLRPVVRDQEQFKHGGVAHVFD